ncbi:hypothetical protein [Sulfurovum sp.]|uniref:hypothetical protein n=1 Tax=Sulfurovum sp. TaxID=1969726 RepID=UPI002867BE39|nr:hypothetical protein [Sulfurovum sp.]
MKIQVCKKFSDTNKLQKKLAKAFVDDTITVKSCIDMCNICKQKPTASIDGTKLKAQSISKLISKIAKL